jgi:hypothetical protein
MPQITLTSDESLVLFELLSRFANDQQARELQLEHRAELQALHNLCALLESSVGPEPFGVHYAESFAQARSRLLAGMP